MRTAQYQDWINLTKQQRKAVEYVVAGETRMVACAKAGYKTPRQAAFSVFNSPHVKKYLSNHYKKTENKQVDGTVTADFIIRGIKEIALKKTAKDADRLKAYELLGKTLAMFTEKHEWDISDDIKITWQIGGQTSDTLSLPEQKKILDLTPLPEKKEEIPVELANKPA